MPQIHRDKSMLAPGPKKGTWRIAKPFVVDTPFGHILVPDGYVFNKDTLVRNSPDWVPSGTHDWAYEYQVTVERRLLTRLEADIIYYVLNANSVEAYNRSVAARNFTALRGELSLGAFVAPGAWLTWNLPGRPKQTSERYEALRAYWLKHGHL